MRATTLLLLALSGCPWISETEHTDRLDVDGDGVPWPEDCDETDPTVHPGADEICGDGVQNDCGTGSTECRTVGDGARADTLATRGRGPLSAAYGWSLAVGDLDGKGTAEVVVGAPTEGGTGKVYVHANPDSLDATDAWRTLENASSGYAGFSVAVLGGRALAVGDPYGPSRVTVVSNLASRLEASSLDVDTVVGSGGTGSGFGMSLAGLGTALVVGAPGGSTVQPAVYLFEQPGLTLDPGSADLALAGAASSYAGASVAIVGDVDGDGVDELAIGGPYDSSAASAAGAVWLVSSDARGAAALGDLAKTVLKGDTASLAFGYRLAAAGDVDEDGHADLLVAALGYGGTGAAMLFTDLTEVLGGPGDATAVLPGAAAGDSAGLGLGGALDLDADGHVDLGVGAMGADLGGTSTGAAWIVYGPDIEGLLLPEDADLVLWGPNQDCTFGWSMLGVPDVDGDSTDEVLVGAPATASAEVAGAVYLLHGRGL